MGISDAFGAGSAISQIFYYQVAGQIVQDLLGPTLELVAQKVNAENPVFELTPADLAQLVVRNYMPMSDAASAAARSGLDAGKFADLVHIAGDAPAPGDLATALRRGLIHESGSGVDSTSFDQGIREGRLADKWIAMIKGLATEWPSPIQALDATLKGQIDLAGGKALYQKLGGDPQFFQLLYDSQGNAPTPVEALELVNRGIIPWTGTGPDAVSYEQAFLEGPWRNKWLKPYEALGEYLPPPRTVTAMLRNGSLTIDQATALFVKSGLSKELAAAYVNDALNSKNQAEHDLTVSEVLDLYGAGLISRDVAKPLLEALRYSDDNIDLLFSLRDARRAIAAINAAVNRIHTLYTTYKLGFDDAKKALTSVGVPADQVSDVLGIWSVERAANVKSLTAAEIVDAWFYQIIGESEALSELESIGYTPRDAWIRLSIKNKGPLDSAQPAQGPGSINPVPAGGTP